MPENPLWLYVAFKIPTTMREPTRTEEYKYYEHLKDLVVKISEGYIEVLKAKTLSERAKVLDSIEAEIKKFPKHVGRILVKEGFAIKPFTIDMSNLTVENAIERLKAWLENFNFEYHEERKIELKEAYRNVCENLSKTLNSIGALLEIGLVKGYRGLIDTLTSNIFKTTLFIPSAVYGAILPDISLYAHLVTTSALATSLAITGNIGYDIIRVDVSGIQSFLTKFARARKAAAFIRGRSLMIELLQRAAARYITETLGLYDSNVIVTTAGQVELITPIIREDKLNEIRSRIEKLTLTDLQGELYISIAKETQRGIERERGFRDLEIILADGKVEEKTFTNMLLKISMKLDERKYKRYSMVPELLSSKPERKPQICPSCKITLPLERMIDAQRIKSENPLVDDESIRKISQSIFGEETFLFENRICPLCFKTYLLGYAGRNMKLILEIYLEDIKPEKLEGIEAKLFDLIVKGFEIEEERLDIIPVVFSTLQTIYLIVASRKRIEKETKLNINPAIIQPTLTLLKHILERVKEVAKIEKPSISIKIYAVNDLNFIENLAEKLKAEDKFRELIGGTLKSIEETAQVKYISISNLMLNTWVPLSKEGYTIADFDEIARPPGKEQAFMLSWCKIDGDHIGEITSALGTSISRYLTFSLLLTFFFNIIVNMLLFKKEYFMFPGDYLFNKIYMVYSGGDDMLLVGEAFTTLRYCLDVEEQWEKVFPFTNKIKIAPPNEAPKRPITISAGLYITDPETPTHIAYTDNLIPLLDKAKGEGRDRIALPTLETQHVKAVKEGTPQLLGYEIKLLNSLTWEEYRDILEKASQLHNKLRQQEISKTTLYKLFSIAQRTLEVAKKIDILKQEALTEICRLIVAYEYILNRLREEQAEKLRRIIEGESTQEKPRIIEFIEKLTKSQYILSITLLRARIS